jgi:sugar-specific transcriptional regulator TrmB
VGYDNERGKGDHRHIEGREMRYRFVSVEQLVADFLTDVERIRRLRSQRKD